MPTKCSVKGCDTFYTKGNPFFNLPTELQYKYAFEKAQLAKKRKKLWLEAMGIQDDEASKMIRICSKHFLSGKPAGLENATDIDWVPSFNMNLTDSTTKAQHKRKTEGQDKEKKSLSKRSTSRSLQRSSSSQRSRSSHRSGSSQESGSSQRTPSQRSASSQRSTPSLRSASSQRSVSSLRSASQQSTSSQKNTRNNIAKKSDLKKLLSCKVLLDGTLRSTTFNGTNGSGIAILQKHGTFTSDNITLNETAVNNTVLRIQLFREDLDDLKRQYKLLQGLNSNKRKRKVQQVSSFGRQIKKRRYFYDYIERSSPSTSNKKIQNVERSPSVDSDSDAKPYKNNSFVNTDKAVNIQMKNKREIEAKKPTIHSKLELRPTIVRHSFENNKTLNKTIRKNDRDKIRVKFFPKTSTPVRNVINGSIAKMKPTTPLQLRREILFVKQYKNEQLRQQEGKMYYLKFPNNRYHEDGMLSYPFQKLVTDVKHMKLPAPSWKIKVIIRQGKISAITFTNKLLLERCVGFSVNNDRYRITIDNRPALLLGSPNSVSNATELEILLDIIENIEPDNPMIFYK